MADGRPQKRSIFERGRGIKSCAEEGEGSAAELLLNKVKKYNNHLMMDEGSHSQGSNPCKNADAACHESSDNQT
jgi:hypothetical protein